jgi:hypothetical protein
MIDRAVVDFRQSKPVKVSVKAHPTWKSLDISRFFQDLDNRYELVNSSFDGALADADLVVSAASSVGVYPIAHGIPCVIVGSPGMLLQNPIPEDVDERLWKVCYSAAEITFELERYSALDQRVKEDLQQAARTYCALQFVPVTREGVYDFIGGSAQSRH